MARKKKTLLDGALDMALYSQQCCYTVATTEAAQGRVRARKQASQLNLSAE